MQKSDFEFEVLVNGKSVAEYAHEGKTFIEGKEGTEFTLKFRNRSSRRALFVPTIDGLSVMDGKVASLDSSGYIVGPYNTETISGWRISDEKVAKFFFSALEDSYAADKGQEGNVGVIGCAVFREKEPVYIQQYVYQKPIYDYSWNWPGVWFTSTSGSGSIMSMSTNALSASLSSVNAMNCSSDVRSYKEAPAQNLGTGFGESKQESVRSVSFERELTASALFEIFYNTRANLKAMGVEFKKPLYITPSAFPNGDAYCKPPQGWQG
jgi:hypothetical protein